MMHVDRSLYFPPVAGDVSVSTKFAMPVSLTPLANDVSYREASIEPSSIDLDPATAGQQTSMSVAFRRENAQRRSTNLLRRMR
jgi:hypothetical protein